MLNRFFSIPTKYFLLLGIGLYLILHLPFVNLPPTGNHVWRQSNSLAIAKNYYEDGLNIIEPKIDKRYDGSGVTGTNFPLYEWVLAVNYKIWGFSHAVHRMYAMLITFLCFLLVYLNFKSVNVQTGRLAAWIFLFNPLVFYYGFSALPDMMAILLVLAANYYIIAIVKNNSVFAKIALPICISLGLLIKFTFIAWLAIPFLVLHSKKVKPQLPILIMLGLPAMIPVFMWYRYANQLTALAQGNVEFVYYARMLSTFEGWSNLFTNLLSAVPELFFGYPGLILLLLGFIFGVARPNKGKIQWIYWVGALAMAITYLVSASHNLIDHDYYFLPLLGLLLVVLSRLPKKAFSVSLMLMLLMPVWSAARIIPANWVGVDSETLQVEKEWLAHRLEASDRVICGTDPSSCYLFYMLGVKGYPYLALGELEEVKDGQVIIDSYINQGAKYLITNQSMDLENDGLKKYFAQVEPFGTDFWLITLKPKK